MEENKSEGVLIDNDSGEETEPHPLETGGEVLNDQDDTSSGDQQGDQNVDTNDNDGTAGTTKPTPEPTAKSEAPQAPAPRLEDPGEFVPNKDNKYSFDVTLADGSKYRVEKPEDIDKLPPTPEFATVQDHAKFNAAYTRMITGLDNDKRDWEKSKTDFDTQQEQAQVFEQEFTLLTNGLDYLEKEGALPKVPAQYEKADWSDPEVAKQPGVKERVDLINFMMTENQKRTAAGLPKMSILDANEKMQNSALREQLTQKTQKQNELRKQRGAMVGGNSAPAPNRASTDMIVGSGGSLRDL